ncbi:MAG: cytochrome P450, partial [Solirubrobacteraceae bacterium]|nr:cytochrome P450 [Solirubrobacteraceae bacterium]
MGLAIESDLQSIDVSDLSLWQQGPPHWLFAQLREQAPVHWSPLNQYPDDGGFWSITRWEDVDRITKDFETFSSERGGILMLTESGLPLVAQQQQMISMDPPRHDRLKAIFQRGFTPARIAEHEARIREIVRATLDRVAPLGECDLVDDIGQPVVSRVIGSFIGSDPEDDKRNAEMANMVLAFSDEEVSASFEEIGTMIEESYTEFLDVLAERRAEPGDDLVSVLAHAVVDGEQLTDFEIFMGIGLLSAAGNDSTRATFASGMLALLRDDRQRQLLTDDPSLIPGAVEEFLRCFPAFAHFRRTATRDVELHGQTIREGDKVVLWYLASNRDATVFDDADTFDVLRDPKHQAFGGGGRHFCLGAALARMELRLLVEETLKRFPDMELAGEPVYTKSCFVNQLKSFPVRFTPQP